MLNTQVAVRFCVGRHYLLRETLLLFDTPLISKCVQLSGGNRHHSWALHRTWKTDSSLPDWEDSVLFLLHWGFYLMFNQHSWMLSWGFSLWWYDILPYVFYEKDENQCRNDSEATENQQAIKEWRLTRVLEKNWPFRGCDVAPSSLCPLLVINPCGHFVQEVSLTQQQALLAASGACVRLSNLILSDLILPFSTWEKQNHEYDIQTRCYNMLIMEVPVSSGEIFPLVPSSELLI